MSTLNANVNGQTVLWVKGAPDVILERCAEEFREGDTANMTEDRRADILEVNRSLTNDALRTLAVAFRILPGGLDFHGMNSDVLESRLVFVGLIGMIDPPRPEASDAVKRAKEAGIRPVMITGDHPGTALAIAKEVGIDSRAGAVTGPELDRMSTKELASILGTTSVYARVNPGHKLRIVDAVNIRRLWSTSSRMILVPAVVIGAIIFAVWIAARRQHTAASAQIHQLIRAAQLVDRQRGER